MPQPETEETIDSTENTVEESAVDETTPEGDTADEEPPFIIEQDKRLSHSLIWKLQQNFFDKQGMNAWRDSIVPHYITSNAFIADAYAKVVFAFFHDCAAVADNAESSFTPLDINQPIYMIELGCGHGRFAFHFLKKFRELHHASAIRGIPYKYIMSDTSEQNVEFWRSHEKLQPFLEEGILDFARFNPGHDQELKPTHGGETLTAGKIANPIVFISNYFFDGIAHDAFLVKEGKLHESLVAVTSPQEEPDLSDPEIIGRMSLSYYHQPAKTDYYDKPQWNKILRSYAERLADTAFLFPTGPMECIDNLKRLSGGRMLLISADRGNILEDELQGSSKIGMAIHGSFSLQVNYHALGQYVTADGGAALLPGHRANSLVVAAFLYGQASGGFAETRQAYEKFIEAFGPDDFFVLKNAIQKNCENYSLEQLMAFVRLSSYDAKILYSCFPVLMMRLENASENQKRELHAVIHKVWDNYYSFGDSLDIPLHLAGLLCQMHYYREALEFLDYSISEYGNSPGTYYNVALCHMGFREMDRALECVHKSLEMDPDFEPARGLRVQLESTTE